jgi:hypothetical protein
MSPENAVEFLIENAIQWVETQRDEHRLNARNLTQTEKFEFAPFFDSEILDLARIKIVPIIENPGFYSDLQDLKIPKRLNFNNAAGITFKDTILISQRYLKARLQLKPLIFHELVHVVQYEVFGVREFIARYVRSWADNGFNYSSIHLEIEAYKLVQRYEKNPEKGFPVIEKVRQRRGERSQCG